MIEPAACCVGNELNSLIVEPPERANRLGANVEYLVLGGTRKKLSRLHPRRKLTLRNSSALYPIDGGILPIVAALEAEGDIMAIGAPECGGIAGPAAFDDGRAACP